MSEESDLELIDKYLENKLSPTEVSSVQQRIQADPEFAALYNDMKYLVESTKVKGRNELINFLQSQKDETEESTEIGEPTTNRAGWYWSAGAAAVIAIVSIAYLFQLQGNTSEQVLLEEYFAPYPNVVVPVVRGSNNNESQRAKAFRYYEQADYTSALLEFEALADQNTDDWFYMGVSALALGEYSSAIKYLDSSNGESFSIQSRWYLALAYIGNGEFDRARERLHDLANGNNKYSAKASELLSKIGDR